MHENIPQHSEKMIDHNPKEGIPMSTSKQQDSQKRINALLEPMLKQRFTLCSVPQWRLRKKCFLMSPITSNT